MTNDHYYLILGQSPIYNSVVILFFEVQDKFNYCQNQINHADSF